MSVPILPKWAVNNVPDPISLQNNVVPPPPEKELEGWFLGEKPNRQWWNWLHRQTYLNLVFLRDQGQTVTTNSAGVGLFPLNDAIVTIEAIDLADKTKYYRAMGIKLAGLPVDFTVATIQNSTLTLGIATASGDQPILGGANVIIRGTSSKIIV